VSVQLTGGYDQLMGSWFSTLAHKARKAHLPQYYMMKAARGAFRHGRASRVRGDDLGSWLSTQLKKITIPGVIKAALPAAAPSPVPVLPSRSAFPAWLPWAAGGVVAAGVGVLLLRKRRQ
jgi:hypothetical protein